jgi:hypothetical protein
MFYIQLSFKKQKHFKSLQEKYWCSFDITKIINFVQYWVDDYGIDIARILSKR